jgi:hypothetical protein
MGVAVVIPWPAAGQLFTVDDLERTPDDGRRYELVDGVAHAADSQVFRATRPFDVEVVPARLVAGLLPD